MSKKLFMRAISVCMIISICLIGFNIITTIAKEPEDPNVYITDSAFKDYGFWTFSDLGVANQTSNKNLNWNPKAAAVSGSLDKSVFNGKIDFPAGTDNFGNYIFGCSQNWYGFIIFANGTGGLKLYYNCKETGHFHNGVGDTGSTKHANNQIAFFDSETAGVALRGNANLQFSMSFEFVNESTDKTDIRVGVFFGGKLYNNEYYTVKDIPKSELSKNLGFYVANSASYTVASHHIEKESIMLESSPQKDFDFWTFSDLGIANQTANKNLNWAPKAAAVSGSLDRSAFNGKIDFPAGTDNFGNYLFGCSQNWYGFIIFANGTEGLKLYYNCKETGHFHNAGGDTGSTKHAGNQIAFFDSETAGVALRGNADLQFTMSFEFVNESTDKTDIKVGVFFGGKLYNGEYYTVKDIPKSELSKNLGFYVANSASYTVASHTPVLEDITLENSPEKEFDFWTFSDLGISDKTSNANLNWNPKATAVNGSLDKSVFDGKIDFPAGTDNFGNYIFGCSQNWYGFIIFANGTEGLKLYYNCKETGHFHNAGGDTGSTKHANNQIAFFDSKTAGTTLRGNADLQFSMSFEFINESTDKTDIKVGVFFDGKLYNNEYYTVKDIPKSELSKNLGFYVQNSAKYTVASIDNAMSTLLLADVPEGAFDFWTFSDLGIPAQTSNSNLNWAPKASCAGNSLDKTVFNAKIDFPADTTNFGNYYIGNAENWYGFAIFADGSDGLKLYYNCKETGKFHNANGNTGLTTVTEAGKIASFNPNKAGTTLRGNKDLQFSLSVEYVNDNGNYTDLKVGVFFDGKLYRDEYYIVKDIPKNEPAKNLGFYVKNSASYTIDSIEPDSDSIMLDESPEAAYDFWTFADLRIVDQTSSERLNFDPKQPSAGNSLDKTVFDGRIDFPAGSDTFGNYYFGAEENWYGFAVVREGTDGLRLYYNCKETGHFHNSEGDTGTTAMTNTQIAVFHSIKAGEQLRGNPDLRFSLSVEYVNETDTHTDLKVGVFFGGKLYAGKYYTVKDVPKAELAKNLAFYVQNDAQYTIHSVGKVCFVEKAPADHKNITLMDAGILDVKESAFAGRFDLDSLDGTLFSAKIKYNADNSRLHLGYGDEELTYGGISFRLTKDKLVVSNEYYGREVEGYGVLYHMPSTLISMSAKTADIGTTFADTEFLLQTSIDFVDCDDDGAKDDIKLGIFINDVLYNNMYFYILDDAENLGTRINFNSGKVASCASYNYEGYYDELTPESFGFGKTVNSDKTGNYDSETLDHTGITTMLKFPSETGNEVYFGGENAGIRLAALGNGKISVGFVDSVGNNTKITTLTPKKAGVSKLTDEELKWRFAFRVTPTSDSDSYLKLSIYINGKLYDGTVFTLSDAETASLKRTMSVKVAGGKFTVSNVNYEMLSLEDFSIKNQNITQIAKKDWRTENYCDLETLDGTRFSAICRFPKDGSARFSFGSPFWFGAFLSSTSDGRIQVAFCDTDKTVKNIAYLNAQTAGLSSFTDKEFKVTLEFDILNNENGKADLILGIYINDKMYSGEKFCVRNISPECLTRNLQLYVLKAPFIIKSAKPAIDLSVYGFSNAGWKKQLGIG